MIDTKIESAMSRAYHAGVDAGRKLAKQEAAEYAAFMSAVYSVDISAGGAPVELVMAKKYYVGAPTQEAGDAKPVRAAKATKAPKATKAAGEGKRASGPRTKGVKKGILDAIYSEPMTVSGIVAATGFKPISVRATLMSLKKSGAAYVDEAKHWHYMQPSPSSNSEASDTMHV